MEEKFLSSARNCIVIVCCTVIGIFIAGTARLSGPLFVACMERYNVGRKDASFPFALCYTIRNVSGPLVGYLGRRFGAVDVTILGCVLSIVGVGACFFAADITTIIVLWGCIYGLGFGLGTTLAPEILRFYFTKHYDKANGMYTGGSSASAMLLLVITDILLHTYGISGAFLVLSGLMMHTIVAAVVLKNYERRRNLSKNKFITTEDLKDSIKPLKDNEVKTNSIIEQPAHSVKKSSSLETDRKSEPHDKLLSSEVKVSTAIILRKEEEACEKAPKENILLDMLQMFLDPTFIIISITQCISVYSFSVLFTIIVDFSRDIGVSADQELYIFIALIVGDIVGRFTLGFITDGGYMSKKNFAVSCYILFGVSVWTLSEVYGFIMTMVAVCAVGLLLSGQIVVASGLVVVYMERDKVMLTFACRLFIYPLFGFSQPYITAYFRDVLGSYNGFFYLLAVINIVSGLLTMLLPLTARWKWKRKQAVEKS